MSTKATVIRDDILGDVTIPAELVPVVDHRYFQRLRGVGQTGLLYLVYPGMRHTRFEHSLGSMHLALEWYKAMKEVFTSKNLRKKYFPLDKDLRSTDGSTLLIQETERLWKQIVEDKTWQTILSAAALLHDVGHGPFSHSIESYGLLSLENFEKFVSDSNIEGFVRRRSKEHEDEIKKDPKSQNKKKLVSHEDFSVVLAFKVLSDGKVFPDSVENRLFVCSLISKDFRAHLLKENKNISADDRMILEMTAPLISGLFDVDRMDYMRRDSTKAGVKFGLSEVQRLMSCLIPTLVSFPRSSNLGVNIVTRTRNVHMIDHFLVGLFQLYTTLYMHPSYEGYQHELGLAVETLKKVDGISRITLSDYEFATDSWLIEKLNGMGNRSNVFNKLVSRTYKSGRRCFQTYAKTTVESVSYELISGAEREIIKDGIKLWLIDELPNNATEVRPWDEFSLVAKNLKAVKHTPFIWWTNQGFVDALKKIETLEQTAATGERKSGT